MKRTGWVLKNVPDPETIAGHMYRMAMFSFLVDKNENLDKVKYEISFIWIKYILKKFLLIS